MVLLDSLILLGSCEKLLVPITLWHKFKGDRSLCHREEDILAESFTFYVVTLGTVHAGMFIVQEMPL